MVAAVGVTSAYAIGMESDIAVRILDILTIPAFGFAGAMFGQDSYNKQSPSARRIDYPEEEG